MQKLINLALRRNLFFPTAEIYTPYAGFYDYGPIGVKIKNNIINFWRNKLLEEINAFEIDGATILPEKVLKASGHYDNFSDPVVKCKKCGTFYRADKLLEKYIEINENTDLNIISKKIKELNINCPKCGNKEFSDAFRFNLMFKLQVGVENNNIAYLRPEACQNIFLNFNRIYKTSRQNLPIAIAQVGKAYRNEIAPRNSLIRLRELTQMDIEVFFDPNEKSFNYDNYLKDTIPIKLINKKEELNITLKELIDKNLLKYNTEIYFIALINNFFKELGFNKIRFKQISEEERPFYSLATWDLEAFVEELGWIEIVALNYRTDHDLKVHSEHSKTNLEVISNSKKILPHVFEISMGLDRIFYSLLAQNLIEINNKLVLKLNMELQPYDFAIFPLVKKDGVNEKAKEILNKFTCDAYKILYDEKGSIGKRYARIDEIGIRYAITVDYDSLEKNTVTIRDSWTTQQKTVKISELPQILFELKYNKKELI